MPAKADFVGQDVAIRGALVHLTDDPFFNQDALVYEPDGLVICRGGLIAAVGAYEALKGQITPGATIQHHRGCLITPGFIDTHVHYAQTGMIGAYGEQLLDWLDQHAFPAEQAFADRAHADAEAAVFCDELLRNGTTCALVFCTVHAHSADALFEAARARGMRMIAGKVMMDRNAPAPLLDDAQSAYDDSKALIGRWHGRDRLSYAVTPRFAPTSTPAQLDAAGALRREHEGVFLHTHLCENRSEIDWVKQLFPQRSCYLDVYDHHQLTGPRAVFAHGVHMDEGDLHRCHDTGSALAHCPTSNLFLGSGLFDIRAAKDARRPVHVGLGTDIGAGTSLSLLRTAGEAYKVAQMGGYALSAAKALFLATLGGARALGLDDKIGVLKTGAEADLAILDPAATPLLAYRNARSRSIEETLFVLMTLGDDRAVRATYVAGRLAHQRDAA